MPPGGGGGGEEEEGRGEGGGEEREGERRGRGEEREGRSRGRGILTLSHVGLTSGISVEEFIPVPIVNAYLSAAKCAL